MSDMNLSHTRIRGQDYDGASNMSGAFNGLKTLIMNDTKFTYFVHCFAHQLQLALLLFVAKTHTKVNSFFHAVSNLLNIIGASYKRRDKLRDKQATKVVVSLAEGELESGKGQNQELGIKRPCDTRWGSHYATLFNITIIYSSICEVSNLHHYQDDVFYAVIDMQLQKLSYPFNEVNTRLLHSMACLCPSESFKAFNLEKLTEMATFYPKEYPTVNDLQLLELELQDYIKDVRGDENFNHLK
uniref:uncharacterized protein LOC122587841 n=1 Tax=Erigeron canadensis TaxID=72917 RepID=UPI001CB934A0|nr:uncharacterized protein LOC122587841 [Erigeron canadensis]